LFYASACDLIKSQSQFAIYDRRSRLWKGNLTTMTVGEGYMVKTSKKQTFRYPAYANLSNQIFSQVNLPSSMNGIQSNSLTSLLMSLNNDVKTNSAKQETSSSLKLADDLLKYSETMNIIARIPNGYESVQFYNNETNELIGQSQIIQNDTNKLAFVTIYGDVPVNIKAELIKDNEATPISNKIVFNSNSVLGTLQTPYEFTISKQAALSFNAYPNPFINDVTVEFDANMNGIATINIYNDQSRVIESKQINVIKGRNKYNYHSNKAVIGNYIVIRVEVDNNIYSKVILKQ
jgi:hypothetical protein